MQTSTITLVLMPGLEGTGELFADFATALPDSFSTITLRYPHNASTYSELLTIVSAAVPHDKPFALVAESFSTPLAIQFAATRPPGLVTVVLSAGFASSPIRRWKRALASIFAPVIFRLPLSNAAARRMLAGSNADDALLARILSVIRSVPAHTLIARLRQVLNSDVRSDLRAITVPILYLQAARDKLINPASLEEIRSIRHDVVLQTIDSPHLLLQSSPGKAAAVITPFICSALDTLKAR